MPGFQGSKFGAKIVQREGALAAAVFADREALVALLVAVDDHERDLRELAVADPLADRLIRIIDFDPDTDQACGERMRSVVLDELT